MFLVGLPFWIFGKYTPSINMSSHFFPRLYFCSCSLCTEVRYSTKMWIRFVCWISQGLCMFACVLVRYVWMCIGCSDYRRPRAERAGGFYYAIWFDVYCLYYCVYFWHHIHRSSFERPLHYRNGRDSRSPFQPWTVTACAGPNVGYDYDYCEKTSSSPSQSLSELHAVNAAMLVYDNLPTRSRRPHQN